MPITQTLSEIASGTKIYQVPPFQRDYSWEKEQCQDLWNDMKSTIDSTDDKKYFLGVLILLEQSQGKIFEIIDGQQRLTCLWLLMAASLSILRTYEQKDENTRILKDRYIQFQDVNTNPKIKLLLNRNNNSDFEHICNKFEIYEKRDKKETETKINLINDTFWYWSKKLKSEFKTAKSITGFLDKLTNRLIFTVFISHRKWSAYKIFETTNNRGIRLTTADLLKNYLISCISEKDDLVEDIDKKWWEITSQLHGLPNNSLNDFIRYHYAFTHESVTERTMFKKIKKRLDSSRQDKISVIQEYIASLKKFAPFFAALHKPEDKLWTEMNFERRKVEPYLNFFKNFSFRQPFLILTIALDKFEGSEFLNLLKNLYVISIRYNVICYMTANKQEKNFAVIARKIYDGEYFTCSDILKSTEFKDLYQDDIVVRDKFKKLSVKTAKKAKHLLVKIEKYCAERFINEEEVSIEHILPKTFLETSHWLIHFQKTQTELVYRLGNMTILPRGKDKLGARSFHDKKSFYEKSNFSITREVSKFDEWTEAEIELRQEKWSHISIGIWQIPKIRN